MPEQGITATIRDLLALDVPKRGEPRVLEIAVADGVRTVRLVVG